MRFHVHAALTDPALEHWDGVVSLSLEAASEEEAQARLFILLQNWKADVQEIEEAA